MDSTTCSAPSAISTPMTMMPTSPRNSRQPCSGLGRWKSISAHGPRVGGEDRLADARIVGRKIVPDRLYADGGGALQIVDRVDGDVRLAITGPVYQPLKPHQVGMVEVAGAVELAELKPRLSLVKPMLFVIGELVVHSSDRQPFLHRHVRDDVRIAALPGAGFKA